MPRWLWITLFLATAAMVWAGQAPSVPPAALAGGVPVVCRIPDAVAPGAAPHQGPVPSDLRPFQSGGFTITPLASFSLDGRVLAREDYSYGTEAELSPTDLALGWQRMVEPRFYEPLGISQSGRWYRYQWGSEGPPLPLDEIIRSSANMHLIPADAAVADALARIEEGQSVRLQGWLVEASRDGWTWRSSLTREDSGDGSCELIYVCALSAR